MSVLVCFNPFQTSLSGESLTLEQFRVRSFVFVPPRHLAVLAPLSFTDSPLRSGVETGESQCREEPTRPSSPTPSAPGLRQEGGGSAVPTFLPSRVSSCPWDSSPPFLPPLPFSDGWGGRRGGAHEARKVPQGVPALHGLPPARRSLGPPELREPPAGSCPLRRFERLPACRQALGEPAHPRGRRGGFPPRLDLPPARAPPPLPPAAGTPAFITGPPPGAPPSPPGPPPRARLGLELRRAPRTSPPPPPQTSARCLRD